jgi:LmbE family N-acetylglucosaminyl deacetylase
MRPHIWYVPHPDDETIFMGGSIAARPHRRNILVVLTRGHASMARHRVNARLDGELSTEEFGHARVRELRAAARVLGVARDDLIVHDLPDGKLHVDDVHEIIVDMARRHPRARHRTMSYLDPHHDHRTAGWALQAAHDAGHVRRARFHLPVPLAHVQLGSAVKLPERARAAKQRALREYRRWRPSKGRYAVGAHSVPRLIRRQLREPVERVHGPGYEPAEAWHQRVEETPGHS